MKIGFIVDGQGEPGYFSVLLSKIKSSPHTLLTKTFYAGMQPRATPLQIARAATGAVKVLAGQVDKIVVLIDSEGQPCPGTFATQIQSAFSQVHGTQITFAAVVKHRAIENWLLADPDAFNGMRARFLVEDRIVNQVANNKADHVLNPAKVLDSMAQKASYHKRNDPPKIAAHQDPLRVAKNSRSFRRFLRVLEHPIYAQQSKLPT